MRITGGAYSGRRVECPRGVIRPAMDRMRESVFAILGDLEGLSFLDLFSGSGVVALEALSRRAAHAVLVEADKKKRASIEKNTSFLDERITLYMMPVETFIKKHKGQYDIVFLDPPFAYKKKETLIQALLTHNLIAEGGLVLLHYPGEDKLKANNLLDAPPTLTIVDHREYGRSEVLFLKKGKLKG
jgi:16S rRNA (guanine966-N2)-methyltransferase